MTDNLATGTPTLAALYGEVTPLAKVISLKYRTSPAVAQAAIDNYMGAEPGYNEDGSLDYDYWDQPDTTVKTDVKDVTGIITDTTKAAGGLFQTITAGIQGLRTPVTPAPATGAATRGTDWTPYIIPGLTIGGVLLIMGLKKKARRR